MRLILASASPIRAELLRRAGVVFETVGSGVDEDPLKARWLGEGAGPAEIAGRLAEAKATAVAGREQAWVIGADQTLEFEGRLVDKAPSREAAQARLLEFRGRAHQLHSAVVLTDGAAVWRTTRTATLQVREFSDGWIDGYVARAGSALTATVGGYELEGEGVHLFSRVEGDYFSILGLPLVELLGALREHGVVSG